MIRFIQAAHNDNGAAFPKTEIAKISQETGLPEILSNVLYGRGIKTAAEAKAFLSCGLEGLHDPFLLKNMEKAVQRIKTAIDQNERIMVYGDYDCDGLTAAAILIRHFKKLGADVAHYIPKRYDEGYGLNMQAMETIAKSGCRLLVTVDCGVTAIKEADHACSLGIDVVITDHHQCLKDIPQCYAVINPKQPEDTYPFKELSGAGIAAKLIQALSGRDALMDYLDMTAVGTIADIVPLLDENRIIAAQGIQKIRDNCSIGLNALLDIAGIDAKRVDSGHIAFALAPRINACGRMGDPIKALELLITDDPHAAEETAAHLNNENKRRQEEGSAILSQAMEMASGCDLVKDRAIILCGKGWNQGVVGIVAAKLVETFFRPVILLCEDNGTCTGSGRSIPGVHMFETLERFSGLFTRFGGHEMAGGLTLPADNVLRFTESYKELLSTYDASLFIPIYKYDLPIHISQINTKLVDAIDRLQPFGEGNESPLFLLEDVQIKNPNIFGKQKDHLKATIVQGNDTMEGIIWRGAKQAASIAGFSKYEMIVSPSAEDWNGRKVRCLIQSMHPRFLADNFSNDGKLTRQYQDAMISQLIYNADTEALEGAGSAATRLTRLQMDELVKEKLKGGIHGTLITASTPKGGEMLARLLESSGSADALDYFFCKLDAAVCPYNTVWYAPCNVPDRTAYTNILLYDGCFGTGFMASLMRSSPNAQISICIDDADIEQLTTLAGKYRLSRETLLMYFNLLKREKGRITACKSAAAVLQQLKSAGPREMDEMQLRVALRIFTELGLIETKTEEDTAIRMLPVKDRKDLLESRTFSALERAEKDILKMKQFIAD